MKLFSKHFFRFRISLTFKFIIAMFFLVLMSAAAFGYFSVVREMTLFRSHWEIYGRSMANSYSLLIEHGMGLSDRFFLQNVAERIVENEDVVVWVTDDDNRVPVYIEAKILVGTVKAYLKEAKGLRNPVTSLIK